MNKIEKLKQQFIQDWNPREHRALTSIENMQVADKFKTALNLFLDEYTQQVIRSELYDLAYWLEFDDIEDLLDNYERQK